MRKSISIVLTLAAAAAVAGLLIGIALAHARHAAAAPPLASDLKSKIVSNTTDDQGNQGADVPVIKFAKNPQPAPPFLANDLAGRVITTADMQGKVTILVFWATWCPPCREEIPELIQLQNEFKDRLQVIGVSEDDDASPQEVMQFAKQEGINYPIIMGRDQPIAEHYGGIPALPTTFVINREGRVVQKHIGLHPPELYETEIRSLLGMPVHATVETFDDTGQIFLKNAALATSLPGVDFTGLTAEQKKSVLKRLNSETCTCGCKLTLAQCRLNDEECPVSKKIAAAIIKEVRAESKAASAPAKN